MKYMLLLLRHMLLRHRQFLRATARTVQTSAKVVKRKVTTRSIILWHYNRNIAQRAKSRYKPNVMSSARRSTRRCISG